jgi:hypothetical protein
LLAYFGLTSREEQFVFYGAVGAGVGTFARLTYKNNLLRSYVNEANPQLRNIIGGRYPFKEPELWGAAAYLKHYKRASLMWSIVYPAAFVAYEFVERGPKFWTWSSML